MSIWTDRISTHLVWQALGELLQAVEEASRRESLSSDAVTGLERVRTAQEFAQQRLSSVDHTLLVPGPLETLRSYLANATVEVRAFAGDGQDPHIANANAHIDNVLSALSAIPIVVSGAEVRTLGRASADFRRATETALEETQKQATQVRALLTENDGKIRQLEKDVTAFRERIDKQVSEWQSQFSTAQETRATEFAGVQATRQERFGTVVSELQEKATKHLADLEKLRTGFKSDADTALQALRDDFGGRAGAILGEIEKQKTAVEKLVGVIGNLGVTSGYQTAAKVARGEKQMWQAITVVAFIGFIAFAWDAFLPVIGETFSWASFAGRALLTAAVGLFAAYSAKQGDKAAQIEAHNRTMALELEALGPFIAPLPVEMQEKFREEVGKTAFGGSRSIAAAQGDHSPTGVIDLISEGRLQKFITDIVRLAKDK